MLVTCRASRRAVERAFTCHTSAQHCRHQCRPSPRACCSDPGAECASIHPTLVACRNAENNVRRTTLETMTVLHRVIASANGKGGTGKTSTCVNVAGLSAAAGWRTLLVDLDPQGNAGHDLGYAWSGGGDDGDQLLKALVAGEALRPVIKDARPNLDVICGGSRLDDLDDVVAGRERRGEDGRTLFKNALAPLARDYDLILVDTPPSRRSALVMLALAAARWIIVPTKSDRASIEGLRRLGEQMVAARSVNPSLEVLGAVLFDIGSSATAIRRNAVQDVTDALGGAAPLFNSVVRHAEQVAVTAREQGRLVHELAETAQSAEPYWVALREGRRPQRVAGSAPALAEDYALLTQEVLTTIAAAEDREAIA